MVTPDRWPGPREEEELQLEERSSDPTVEGAIRYVSGSFRGLDATGAFDLRSGTGLTENAHRALRQLIHFLEEGPADGFASGAYKETLPSGAVFPTSVIWWESASKAQKIVERTITWTGPVVTTDEWKIYAEDGTSLLATVSDSISYSGVFETTRTRTITVA